MKTLIAYYSLGGGTRALCESLQTANTDLYEIKETKKRSKFGAFTGGCFKALSKKPSSILPVKLDLSDYNLIILASPIWAGNVAPAITAFLDGCMVSEKKIVGIAVSGSGKDYTEAFKERILNFGAKCANIYNTKASGELVIAELKNN